MLDKALGDDGPITPEEQLNIRIAWYYYVTEMTQQQIADRFGITRVRVNKALATCRGTGVVQIRINSKLASCVRLEHALQQRYGLHEVIVVPTPEDERHIFKVLGVGTSPYLHDHLYDGCAFGVGWGRTLRHTILETRGRPLPGMTVISLMGGLNYGSSTNTIEIAASCARLFGCNYYYLAAPIYMDSEISRDTILAQESIRDAYQKAANVDLALLTVGDLAENSTMLGLGLVSGQDAEALRAAGAVGDILGHYLDANGELVDHPLNRRAISLSVEDLARIRKVILVSGGMDKFEIIRAVLRRKLAHVLVTDERVAERLLD
jgi:DNA-binding transcriptional regulator LsrR (DeoR family)